MQRRMTQMSKIRIEKLSITDAGTDCIVNAANEHLQGGAASAEQSSKQPDGTSCRRRVMR